MGRNEIIPEDENIIPYWKTLNATIGDTTAALLMQQLEYWFQRYPDGIYKFRDRPKKPHPRYKEGDSWCEELCITLSQYRSAFLKIGTVIPRDTDWDVTYGEAAFRGKLYASHFRSREGLLLFFRNHRVADRLFDCVQKHRWIDISQRIWKVSEDFEERVNHIERLAESAAKNSRGKGDLAHPGSFRGPSGTSKILFSLYTESTADSTTETSYSTVTDRIDPDLCTNSLEDNNKTVDSTGTDEIDFPQVQYSGKSKSKKNLDSGKQRLAAIMCSSLCRGYGIEPDVAKAIEEAAESDLVFRLWVIVVSKLWQQAPDFVRFPMKQGKLNFTAEAKRSFELMIEERIKPQKYVEWFREETARMFEAGLQASFTWNRFSSFMAGYLYSEYLEGEWDLDDPVDPSLPHAVRR